VAGERRRNFLFFSRQSKHFSWRRGSRLALFYAFAGYLSVFIIFYNAVEKYIFQEELCACLMEFIYSIIFRREFLCISILRYLMVAKWVRKVMLEGSHVNEKLDGSRCRD
jgi:hypothetical protein